MTANSALALLLLGTAGVLRAREDAGATRRLLATVAAVVALGIGLGTIAEHVLRIDLGLDHLMEAAQKRGQHPRRPSPASAASLALIAGALLALDVRPAARSHLSEWLLLTVALAALTALLGFLFGVELHVSLARGPIIGMALPTAAGLFLSPWACSSSAPREVSWGWRPRPAQAATSYVGSPCPWFWFPSSWGWSSPFW